MDGTWGVCIKEAAMRCLLKKEQTHVSSKTKESPHKAGTVLQKGNEKLLLSLISTSPHPSETG